MAKRHGDSSRTWRGGGAAPRGSREIALRQVALFKTRLYQRREEREARRRCGEARCGSACPVCPRLGSSCSARKSPAKCTATASPRRKARTTGAELRESSSLC